MEINWLKLLFVMMTFVIVLFGCLVNWLEKHIPDFISQTFRYGKYASSKKIKNQIIKRTQVPKKWFRHFYLFAAAYSAFTLVVATNLYFFKDSLEPWMLYCLDFIAGSSRKATTTVISTYLALLMITLQSWHRFYETWFVSIYSNCRINLVHYFVGYLHYFGAITAIITEAPGFISDSDDVSFKFSEIRLMDILGSVSFLWACWNQYTSAKLLANLRKNSKGEVVSHKHMLPKGGWFDFVSSPHFLVEILMYLSIMLILKDSQIWPFVCLWVVCNQVECALLSHWWYKSMFKNYPKKRKAIIPFIL